MLVNEIFSSIEGEGKRAGILCTFIRLVGCNLRCVYCDTTYAFCGGIQMEVEQIISACKYYQNTCVTLTGGEPLIHKDVVPLIEALCEAGFKVNVETNGTVDIDGLVDRDKYPELFFTVDYKCPTSGCETEMSVSMFTPGSKSLTSKDVLKFVVGHKTDLKRANCIIQYGNFDCEFYISPVFGAIEPAEIVEYMKDHRMGTAKIQLQLHKFIWDPNKKGV